MKLEIRTILNSNLSKTFIMFFTTFLMYSCSCNMKQDNLKSIIYDEDLYYNEIILPLVISTSDSLVNIVCTTKNNILTEIKDIYGGRVAKDLLYKSVKSKFPIEVSLQYYKKSKNKRVFMDNNIYDIYRQKGISAVINKFFKKINGSLVLSDSEEMFPIKDTEIYKGFGHDINIEFIVYLLSMHDIYLHYLWLDECGIIRVSIAENISNMSLIND